MNIEELFSGIGMVVDDQVYNQDSSDKIIRIVENLESKGFPLVTCLKLNSNRSQHSTLSCAFTFTTKLNSVQTAIT